MGTVLRDLDELLDSILEADLDDREGYIDMVGLSLQQQGLPWHRHAPLRITGGESSNSAFEMVRSFLPLEDFGESADMGRKVSARFYGESNEPPKDPYLYWWTVATSVERLPTLTVWCLTARPSSSGFTPLLLRQLGESAVGTVQTHLGSFSQTTQLARAFSTGDIPEALRLVASHCRGVAAMLWEYDFDVRQFVSVEAYGLSGITSTIRGRYSVPQGAWSPPDLGGQRGIVGLLRPELDFVIYDARDRNHWTPARLQRIEWEPHDEGIFRREHWRSCLAWPICANGQMVGAITVYSRKSAGTLRNELELRTISSGVAQSYLRRRSHQRSLERIEKQFNEEMDRIGTSLFVLGHVHDFTDNLHDLSRTIEQIELLVTQGWDREALERELAKVKRPLKFLDDLTDEIKRVAKGASERTGTCRPARVLSDIEDFLSQHVQRESRGKARLIVNIEDDTHEAVVAMPALRLERVLYNLVSNAAYWLASSDSRDATIQISCRLQVPGRRELQITVLDNGPGVALEDRERVFDRFFSRRAKGGTGMGLYYARMFAREAGGDIEVRHAPAGGADFWIRLPLGAVSR